MQVLVTHMTTKHTPKPWVIGQQCIHGFRYYTGRAHPTNPDAWTPDIRKAERMTAETIANMRAYVEAYTWGGAPIDKIKAN